MPKLVREVLDGYKDVISNNTFPSWLGYGALISGFVFSQPSLSDIVRDFAWSPSVSTLQRASASFNSKKFMKRLRAKILKYLLTLLKDATLTDFCITIDDTSIEKFSENLTGSGNWATSSKNIFSGHKVLVVTLVNKKEGFAIPLFYSILKKQEENGYENYTTVILNAINTLAKEGFPKLEIVMDSGFGASNLLNELSLKCYTYLVEAKSNRLMKMSPNPNEKYKKPKQIFKTGKRSKSKYRNGKLKYINEKLIYLKGVKKIQKVIAVYNHPCAPDAFAYYITNNLNLSSENMWFLSRDRWRIEQLFRDLKQNLSWGNLPCRTEGAFEMSICIPFAIIASLRIDAEKWNHENTLSNQIGNMLRKIREENFQTSIGFIMNKPQHPKVILLKNRRHINRLTKKPKNSTENDDLIHFKAQNSNIKNPVNSSAEDNLVRNDVAA